MIKKLLLFLIFILIIIYLGMSWKLSNLILFPESSLALTKSRIEGKWGSTFEKMTAALPNPETFHVNSFEGVKLHTKYFKQPDTSQCAIILVHGWTSTWAGMLKYVPAIWDCGCDVLMYDHRAHGLSEGEYATGGINEAKDLIALTNWFQKKTGLNDQQVAWMGASWGAATVLTAGADKKKVAFIIADSPFQDWYSAIFERAIRDYGSWINIVSYGVMQMVSLRAGIDYKKASALLAAPNIDEEVLLIHSKADSETSSQQSVNIAKQLKPDRSSFYHTEWGGDHTQDILINQAKFTEVVHNFMAKFDHFDACSKN